MHFSHRYDLNTSFPRTRESIGVLKAAGKIVDTHVRGYDGECDAFEVNKLDTRQA